MLDKVKIRLMKDQVKNHIIDHKVEYWIGSLVVVAGVTYIVTRRISTPQISVAPVFNNNVAPVFNNVVNFGGHSTKIVKRLSDGAMWESVTEAANAAGKTVSTMSRHLNNYPGFETLDDEIYKIIGVSTIG